MTRITRSIPAALAALAIAAPVATAMPADPVNTWTAAAVGPHTGTADTSSACAPGTRPVQGLAGAGCTTSPSPDSDGLGVFAVILGGAGAFAIALGAGGAAARRHGRVPTPAAS